MAIRYEPATIITCLSSDTKPETGISAGTLCKVITKATTPTGVDTAVWYRWSGTAWSLIPAVEDDMSLSGVLTLGAAFRHDFGNRNKETVAVDKTLDEGDSGVVQVVTADAKTVTLPATALGLSYTIVNGGADGAVAVTISPNASDKIHGMGLTATDDRDLINTKATAKKGDYVKLLGDGSAGWFIQEIVGTWAQEAGG